MIPEPFRNHSVSRARSSRSREQGALGALGAGSSRNPSDSCPPARSDPYRASYDPDQPAGPCRLCGDPSWMVDDRGPVHRCCARAEAAGLTRCGPCAVSREARRRWESNHPVSDGDDRAGGRR